MKKGNNSAINLSALANYQKGAVVSKEILRKNAGTITAFAFDKGEGLSEHTAPYDAFVHILDGEAEITIAKKKHTVRKGEFLILPANTPHALKAVKRIRMLLVMIWSAK